MSNVASVSSKCNSLLSNLSVCLVFLVPFIVLYYASVILIFVEFSAYVIIFIESGKCNLNIVALYVICEAKHCFVLHASPFCK